MADRGRFSSAVVCCAIPLIFKIAEGFFDIDEINSVHYGIEILKKPVSLGRETFPGSVLLTSKYGQEYQCSFPDHREEEKQVEEEEKVAMEIGIPELLKPLESVPCLFKTKDWWSYEFCYGKYIRQYHVEDGKPVGKIMYLGYYESEYNWDNKSDARFDNNRRNRYHSQQYSNGSKCDLNGKSRKTEVRFLCEKGSSDYIGQIDEPETCVYIVTIYTSRTCHHPLLKPAAIRKLISITCNPVLSEEQYGQYLDDLQVEKKKAEEEKRKQEEKIKMEKLNEMETKEQYPLESTEDEFSVVQQSSTDQTGNHKDVLQTKLAQGLTKGLQDYIRQAAGPNSDMQVKVIDQDSDLDSVVEEVLDKVKREKKSIVATTTDSSDHKDKGDKTSTKDSHNDVLRLQTPNDASINTDQDDDDGVLDEFDKELDEIKTTKQADLSRIVKMKNRIQDAMQAQFQDIVNEAENELADEGFKQPVDKRHAFANLAKTLQKLLHRLEKTTKEIKKVDQEIEQHETKVAEDQITDDDTLKWKSKSESSNQKDIFQGQKGGKSDISTMTAKPTKDRIKVRVTRVRSKLDENREIPSKEKLQLEESVKEGLEKAGLDTGNDKVQVRIITSGYYNSKDDTIHILSEEDTAAFQNMIVAILGGNNEASKEAKRQQELEDSYNFVWTGKKYQKNEEK